MKESHGTKNDPEVYSLTESTQEKSNLDGDKLNFYLLILLYIIQGFPIGLCSAFPIILQSKYAVTYEDQALFSITLWPYSFKIIWAPVIDALYIQWIGRRKSWLLPLQSIMGILLIYMAININNWLPETGRPNLKIIIIVVFVINFLSATQDIVTDGWALTMLKKKNVSHASTCNSVGVPLGMFIGSVCFILLESEQFSNKYLRTTPEKGGLLTMKSYFFISGTITLLTTICIGLFKKEKNNRLEVGYVKINVFQNYKLLWNILKLPHIRILAIALLTAKVGFSAMDSVSNLKFIDAGVPKDSLMIINTMMYAVKLTMPLFVSKYVTGLKPMSYYLKITPIKLLWAILYVVLFYYTPYIIHKNGRVEVPTYYYIVLGLIYILNEMMSFFMLLTLYAFFCRLSDPRFGGTYMTLFNTFFYLGFIMSNTFVLKLVAAFTFTKCSNNVQNTCSTSELNNVCQQNGGNCIIHIEGYYIANIICIILGFIWYGIFKNIIKKYQSLSSSLWIVNVKKTNTEDANELHTMI